jgi:O-antigen/teichoic acid export membrane protein
MQGRLFINYIWPFSDRQQLFRWGGVLSAFVGIQLVVQCFAFLGGILVVRTLTKQDYAIYTVAGSALGLLNNLSDLGFGSALLALGGRVWRDNIRMGQLAYAAQKARWRLFLLASIVVTVFFFSLALKAGASTAYALVIWAVLLLSAIFQLNYTIWSVVPRLHAEIARLQRLDLATALLRLTSLAGAALTLINSAIVLAINTAGFALQAFYARRWANCLITPNARETREDRRKILNLVKSQIPNAIFYCVYGQATVLVISIFGRTKEIAEVGALTRLGALFSILGSVMSTVVLPHFARAQTRRELAKKYFHVVCMYSIGSGTFLGLALLYPAKLVWVLGGQYSSLDQLVGWIVLSSLIHNFVGLIWSMNAAKGWVTGAWLTIPLIVLCQILVGACLDLSTAKGAVLFGAFPVLAALLILARLAWLGVKLAPEAVNA